MSRLALTAGLWLLLGCGTPAPAVGVTQPDAGRPDAGVPPLTTDAGPGDAGLDAGAPEPFDAGPPRCVVGDATLACTARVTRLEGRDVYWQSPALRPPDGGFPAVLLFQGSGTPPSVTWAEVAASAPFGGFQQARLQAVLLERGFTVIAPTALGGVAWQTNTGLPWDSTSDKAFIDALLAELRAGAFGPVDAQRLYATGISSGGYMTSRMAVSYPGVFRALAIHSGSYATCAGALCVVPTTLPAQHPPTRFLHGRLDFTVPLWTAETYEQRLRAQGFESDLLISDSAGHEWLPIAPERISEWFQSH